MSEEVELELDEDDMTDAFRLRSANEGVNRVSADAFGTSTRIIRGRGGGMGIEEDDGRGK